MGIERFFSSIERNKITNTKGNFSNKIERKIKVESLGIDFNSIIHVSSQKVLSELNYLLFKIISNNLGDRRAKEIISRYDIRESLLKDPKLYANEIKEDIDELVIGATEDMFFEIFELLVDNKELKELYIAIDGVPGKGKLIEQKKRRFLGTIIEGIKKKILKRYENELKQHPKRKLFEKLKISWSKNNISPGTVFMKDLEEIFSGFEMENELKERLPNLKDYYFSGPSEPGEGEKKIVNYYRTFLHYQKYAIYSPDSDVTLLALLLHSPTLSKAIKEKGINDLVVIRHNQQREHYDVIDIKRLANNFVSHLQKHYSGEIDEGRALEDLVLVFTILGNDFLPKVESFDVKSDFELIIRKYLEFVEISGKNNTDPYLISIDNGKRRLLYKQLRTLMKIFQYNEGGQMNKNYIANNFKNFRFIKKVLDANENNFIEKMSGFLDKIRAFNDDIRNKSFEQVMIKWKNDREFSNKLSKFIKLDKKQDSIIKGIYDYYKEFNRLPKFFIFQKYVKKLDNYHQTKLEAKIDFFGKDQKLLKYDEEIYKMENMLDEYSRKFKAIPSELGKISIDYKTFTWKAEKIVNSVEDYYQKYFGISGLNDKKLNDVTYQYIKGLVWVFNYYYNWYDEEKNAKYALTSYYPYARAPLMSQIHNHLKEMKEDEFNKLSKLEYVERSQFFGAIEALMYVSPVKNNIELVPEEYYDFVRNTDFYPDLNPIINEIFMDDNQDEINCQGNIFLNKCELKLIFEHKSKLSDKEFVQKIREIKVDDFIRRLRGNVAGDHYVHHKEYKEGTTLDKVIKNDRDNLKNSNNSKDTFSGSFDKIKESTQDGGLRRLIEDKYDQYKVLYSHTNNNKFKDKEILYRKIGEIMGYF